MLSVHGHIHSVKPCFLSCSRIFKEENVGCNGRVRAEDGTRESDYSMQIELGKQFFLYRKFGVIRSEEEAVGDDYGGSSVLLQTLHDNGDEKIRSLRGCKIVGEETLNRFVFVTAVRGIHHDYVELFIIRIIKKAVPQ